MTESYDSQKVENHWSRWSTRSLHCRTIWASRQSWHRQNLWPWESRWVCSEFGSFSKDFGRGQSRNLSRQERRSGHVGENRSREQQCKVLKIKGKPSCPPPLFLPNKQKEVRKAEMWKGGELIYCCRGRGGCDAQGTGLWGVMPSVCEVTSCH